MRIDILKCRAKITNHPENKWAYGFAGYDEDGFAIVRTKEIVNKPGNPLDGSTVVTTYRIEINTIDRCTHLLDKNGIEIYENDIIMIDGTDVRGRVWYSNTSGRWHVVSLKGKNWLTVMKGIKRKNNIPYKAHKHGSSLPLWHVIQNGAVIIGNRRDNPELQKAKNDENG